MWRETWAYLTVPMGPQSPSGSLHTLMKPLEHGRDHDLNPAELRGLEASEGARCSGELPNSRS